MALVAVVFVVLAAGMLREAHLNRALLLRRGIFGPLRDVATHDVLSWLLQTTLAGTILVVAAYSVRSEQSPLVCWPLLVVTMLGTASTVVESLRVRSGHRAVRERRAQKQALTSQNDSAEHGGAR